MKLLLISILALASVSLASAQGMYDSDITGVERLRFVSEGDPAASILPSTPALGQSDEFPFPSDTISGQFSPSITAVPEPAAFQLIGLAIGLLAFRRISFRKV